MVPGHPWSPPYIHCHWLKCGILCEIAMRRTLAESSSEHRCIAEHFVRTGAAPSRGRFGSSERNVQKSFSVLRLERLSLPNLESGYRACARAIFSKRGMGCDPLPPDCCALRIPGGTSRVRPPSLRPIPPQPRVKSVVAS